MKALSEQDWQLVNGYHDGELPEPQRTVFEQRLQREPALAEALACLRDMSSGLGRLHPAPPQPAVPAPDAAGSSARPPWLWLAAGTLAASLAVAVAVTVALFTLRPDNSAMALHAAFAEQDYTVDESMLRRNVAARRAGLPDLGAARLALVARRRIEGGIAAHYAGVNDCRLTFIISDTPVPLPSAEGVRSASWLNDTRAYAVIADGMDLDRFRAIIAYLMQLTQQGTAPDTRLALMDATRKATSCA